MARGYEGWVFETVGKSLQILSLVFDSVLLCLRPTLLCFRWRVYLSLACRKSEPPCFHCPRARRPLCTCLTIPALHLHRLADNDPSRAGPSKFGELRSRLR